MSEDCGLLLTPAEVLQLEAALDADAEANPRLAELIRGVRLAQNAGR